MWSWRPESGAKSCGGVSCPTGRAHQSSAGTTGAIVQRSPGRARHKRLKPSAQGRPGVSANTCDHPACVLSRADRGCLAGARPSQRPLGLKRVEREAKLGRNAPRDREIASAAMNCMPPRITLSHRHPEVPERSGGLEGQPAGCLGAVHPSRLPMRRVASHGSHLRMTGSQSGKGTILKEIGYLPFLGSRAAYNLTVLF